MTGTNNLFAVGRIKALESNIIDTNLWHRLFDMNEKEALRTLQENHYGGDSGDQKELETMIDNELASVHQLIKEVSPQPILTNLFLLPVDGYNLKLLLKGKAQEVNVHSFLHEGGSISIDQMIDSLNADRFDFFPEPIEKALLDLATQKDSRIISYTIDQAIYSQIFNILAQKKNHNHLLIEYFKSKIDFTNIITVLRGNALHWEAIRVKPMLLKGGEISLKIMESVIGAEKDKLIRKLSTGRYSLTIRKVLDEVFNDMKMISLEQSFNNALLSIVLEEKNDIFGLGPIINYLLQKEHEAQVLRVMFTGKRAGIELSISELGIV